MREHKFKIMIMTASVGNGHNQAAKVIAEYLLNEDDNIDIEIVDFIDLFPTPIGGIIKNTYLKMIDKVPSWYNLLYEKTMRLNKSNKVSSIFAYKYIKKVRNIIEDFNPDMILFTNPFPSTLVSHLKRRNKINTYTASIITDYTAHSVWLDKTIDSYFVGCSILKQEMIEKGIKSSKIHVTGIPVDSKYNIPIDREKKIIELGLNPNIPTVLVMGGGLGLGSMEEVLETMDKIDKPLQLIVVAGKNRELKERLENRKYNPKHHIKIHGFCHNVHELMACSHVLVSKAGGLTMTEALTKKLPVLIFDPIPGQEVKNAQYFSAIGTAMYLKGLEEMQYVIEELLYENPKKREKMVRCCTVVRRPNATADISRFIMAQVNKKNYEITSMVK